MKMIPLVIYIMGGCKMEVVDASVNRKSNKHENMPGLGREKA